MTMLRTTAPINDSIHIQEVLEKEEMVDLTETGDKAKAEEVEEVASEETEAVAAVGEEEKIAQAGTKSRFLMGESMKRSGC